MARDGVTTRCSPNKVVILFDAIIYCEKYLFKDTCFGHLMKLEKFNFSHNLFGFIFKHLQIGENNSYTFSDTKVRFIKVHVTNIHQLNVLIGWLQNAFCEEVVQQQACFTCKHKNPISKTKCYAKLG